MDYYACFNVLSNIYKKDLALTITTYLFVKCVDCNDMYVSEYYERVRRFRCIQHDYAFSLRTGGNTIIACRYCSKRATFGYKDRLVYCIVHYAFKKITMNRHTSISDLYLYTTSIYDNSGKRCSFCKKPCLNMRSCQCRSYCQYCFVMCVYKNYEKYVCKSCDTGIGSGGYLSFVSMNIMCHDNKCESSARYGIFGTVLFCDKHFKEHSDEFSNCLITDVVNICKYDGCFKIPVGDGYCYEHSSKKIQKIVKYFIK